MMNKRNIVGLVLSFCVIQSSLLFSTVVPSVEQAVAVINAAVAKLDVADADELVTDSQKRLMQDNEQEDFLNDDAKVVNQVDVE